ncbi:hypothetical protein [Hyphococcus sp.]|uniref:hypothetical protein n=1 Tax=Hyphococcus sp. TaxID=2038636 RepID=UPI0020865DE1|nr:MAG: hypothetical protein DHS20C04_30600 [Marinicaulis sp.]
MSNADQLKPRAVQSQPRFIKQLDTGRTKFYEMMANDPRFPKRFKLGGKWVYFVDDCNEFVRQCADAPLKIEPRQRRHRHVGLVTVQAY